MESQSLIDLLFSAFFAIGGWFMNNIWSAVKDLQMQDQKLADKVAGLEVFVTKDYVSTQRFELVMEKNAQAMDKISDKIDKLAERIDHKMDRV